jgi:DNA-binding transcriptional MerR regulator
MIQDLPRKNKRDLKPLPPIPAKRYFTIGEVAKLCALKPYVLRYWEQEFSDLKPAKRRGNRRFYLANDILLVRKIRKLLYRDGFTIEGARLQLAEAPKGISLPLKKNTILKKVIVDLESLLQNLKSEDIVST